MKCSGCLCDFENFDFKTCEKCRLKVKKYHKKNKAQLKQKRKLYCQKNIENIKKSKHQYYTVNKKKISDKAKKYRIKNKYNYLLKNAKNHARIINVKFDLDIKHIKQIWPQNGICYLLEQPMTYGSLYAPSVDRIDCNKGYVEGNIQIISHRANTIKNNANITDLEMVCDYVLKYNNKLVIMFNNSCENIDDRNYLHKKLIRKKAYCKKNNIDFNINCTNLKVPQICPALGLELSINNSKKCDNSPSLDRLIPTKGYVIGNVMIISLKANRIKSNANICELNKMLINWNKKVISNSKQGTNGK